MIFDLKDVKIETELEESWTIPDLNKEIGKQLHRDEVNQNKRVYRLGKKVASGAPFEITVAEIEDLVEYIDGWKRLPLYVKIPLLEYLKTLNSN